MERVERLKRVAKEERAPQVPPGRRPRSACRTAPGIDADLRWADQSQVQRQQPELQRPHHARRPSGARGRRPRVHRSRPTVHARFQTRERFGQGGDRLPPSRASCPVAEVTCTSPQHPGAGTAARGPTRENDGARRVQRSARHIIARPTDGDDELRLGEVDERDTQHRLVRRRVGGGRCVVVVGGGSSVHGWHLSVRIGQWGTGFDVGIGMGALMP